MGNFPTPEALKKLVEQMPRLSEAELGEPMERRGEEADHWTLQVLRDVTQAQREADAEWIVEQGLVRLPSEEEAGYICVGKGVVDTIMEGWADNWDGATASADSYNCNDCLHSNEEDLCNKGHGERQPGKADYAWQCADFYGTTDASSGPDYIYPPCHEEGVAPVPKTKKGGEMVEIKTRHGFCDLQRGDDSRVNWAGDACDSFREKDKQVIDHKMVPYCLMVCGNCEYFTVGEIVHE